MGVGGHAGGGVGEVGRDRLWCGGGREVLRERLLRRVRVEDDYMALLEVGDESVEVGEVEPTAGVVAALRADEMTNSGTSTNIYYLPAHLGAQAWRARS